MNKSFPRFAPRRSRTHVALLLAYLTFFSQLAPVPAQVLKVKRAPASTTSTQQPRKGGTTTGTDKHVTLPAPSVVTVGPNITATKVDAWDDTATPDGKADPGQVVTYTVTVTNTGDADATGVTFADSVDTNTTLVPGSVNTQPIALPDTYNVIGNVRIQPNVAQGLLANDRDPDTGNNTGLTASGPSTSAQGGNVTINADGSFSYNPAPGFAGDDTFTYTITDGGGKTDTATATFHVGNGTATPGTNVVWFVDPSATVGGDGRLTHPYNCYTGTDDASHTCFSVHAADDPGDAIFIFSGSVTGGYALLASQKLIGQGASDTLANIAGLTVPTASDALPTTNATPSAVQITTTNINAIPLPAGSGNTPLLRGFTVGNTGTGTKISGSTFGTLTVGNSTTPDVALSGTGQALNLSSGAFAATSGFASVATTSSAGQGINLAGITGTVAFGSTSVSGSTTQGILVGTTTAAINFGNTSVTGGTDGVSFQNNSSGTRSFGTLGVSGGSGSAFLHGAGGGNVTVNGAATLASAGDVVNIANAASGTSINFAGGATVTKTTTGGNGVNWSGTNTGATLTFATLSLTTSNGTGMNLAGGGTVNVTTAAGSSISSTGVGAQVAPAISATGVALGINLTTLASTNSGGSGSFFNTVTGSLSAGTTNIQNPTGIGIVAASSSATFSFGTTTVNGSGSTGISLGGSGTGNSGAITFGSLSDTPDNNQRGLLAQQNTGAITISSGTITAAGSPTSSGQPAVEITGTSNASKTPINIQLTAVNSNGGAKGIVLNNTSATGSPGGFNVTGTGTTDGSGGTIQNITARGAEIQNSASIVLKNMHFTDANTADAGGAGVCDDATDTGCNASIYLNTVSTVTLDRDIVTSAASRTAEEGIYANSVSAFTLSNSTVSKCGDSVNEHCLMARNMSGTSSITGSTLTQPGEKVIDIRNTTGTLTLDVTNDTISDTQTFGNTGDGFQFRGWGTSTNTLHVNNDQFPNIGVIAVDIQADNSATVNADVKTNTINCGASPRVGRGVEIDAQGTAHANFNIIGNATINSRGGNPVNIFGDGSGVMMGRINTNGININGVAGSNSSGTGIRLNANTNANIIVQVDSNTVSNVGVDLGIDAFARTTSTGATGNGRIDATINGNTITVADNLAIAGIRAQAGSGTSGVTENNTVCVNTTNNTVTLNGGAGPFHYRVRRSAGVGTASSPTIIEQGFVTDTATTWNNNGNTPTTANGAIISQSTAGTGTGPIAGTCTTPTNPNPSSAPLGGQPAPNAAESVAAQSSAQPNDITSKPFVSLPAQLKPAKADASVAASVQTGAMQPAQQSPQAPVSKTEGGSKSEKQTKPVAPIIQGAGGTVNVSIGTLAPGDSVTITFQVTIDNPYTGGANISNQGTVSGSNFSNVLTDDPDVVGSANPTLTPVAQAHIIVNDAKEPEPATGTRQMLFVVTLSQPAPVGGLTVNYATADGTATGGASCDGTADYITASSTATVPAGSQVGTIPVTVCADTVSGETDETLTVTISSPTSGVIDDATATGTITQGNNAGTFLISEFRTRGSGGAGGGAAAPGDDFVELYNNTDSPVTVAASDASGGYGVYKSGAACTDTPVLIGTVPNSTVIPARGHYLLVGSTYSLANYGGTGAAAGDLTMTSDIEDDRDIAVFTTANVANVSSANRLDAVGFSTNTGGVCDLMGEGTGLAPVGAQNIEYSYFRKLLTGTPQDTNANSADFQFADTAMTNIPGIARQLGAPGPENLASPINRGATIKASLIDPCTSSSATPNRERNSSSYNDTLSGTGTYASGYLDIRRRFTNNTGANVTRLRFRVVDVTTGPTPPVGTADLRLISSPALSVSVSGACGGGSVPVKALTLETPPAQPNGGGVNSTVAVGVITTGTPLANGAVADVTFRLGVVQGGSFRFFVIVEALPQ